MCQAGFSANADGSCHSPAARFNFRVAVTGGLLVDPSGPGCVQPSCFVNLGDRFDRNSDLGIDIESANISGSFASGAISGYASGTAGPIARVAGLSPTTTTLTFAHPAPYTYGGTPFTASAVATASDGLNVPVPVVYTGDCTHVTAAGCTATATYHGDSTHEGSAASQTITLTPRPITFKADDVTRIYGETTPAFSYSVAAGIAVAGDAFGAPVFTPAASSAGSHALALSGLSNPDYAIAFAPGTFTVTPRELVVAALAENKVYDGTTSADVTLGDNRIPTDVFTTSYVSASFADTHVGTEKTVHVAGISISGPDQANYFFNTTTDTTADITARALTITATGVTRVYDGTSAATVTLHDDRIGGDVFTTAYAAAFEDRNVGTGKPVHVTGIAISGGDAGNYTANTTASTTADITKRPLTVTATGVNRVYDANTTATVTLRDDRISGDAVTVTYTAAAFANKSIGLDKAVAVSGIAISGGDAGNYSVNTTASTTASITPRQLTVTATGIDTVYDGNTTATVTLNTNALPGDLVTAHYASATFDSANVGLRNVTVTGITIGGVDGGNYTPNATASTNANITARPLTVTASGVNKPYDGTATATVTLSDDRIAGEGITTSYGAATFADENAGVGKTVSVTGIALGGTGATNYVLSNTTASATANITKRPLTVSATAASKVYDGNTTATVTLTDNRISGDLVTLTYTTAGFADKNVGTDRAVTVSGIGVSGSDAGNYSANATALTTANIARRQLAVTATGINKVYDANTTASVTLSDNRISGDVVTVTNTAAAFADKNVGSGKTVTVTGIAITGTDAGNYAPTTTASTTAAITARSLTITAAGVNKVYDGTPSATVSLSDNRASGDSLSEAYTSATFADRNVSNGKTVTVSGISISGADAANYSANTSASASANITPKAAAVAPDAASKTYGTADPPLTGTLTGFLGSDGVTATYSRDAGETVAGSPYAISAALSPAGVLGNYAITNNTANFTIAKATASVSATGGSFTYDTAPHAGSGSATGGRGESLPFTLSYTGTGTTAYGPTATAPINAGTYSVVASTTGDSNNTGASSTPASLTIGKAAGTVTLSSLTKSYTGTAQSPTATTTPGGLAIDWTGAPQTNAGSYPVTATINDRNYQGSASGTFLINPAAATATSTLAVSNLQPQYSDQDTFTVTVTSSAPGQPAAGVNFFVGSQQVGSPTSVTVPLVVVGDPATSTTYKAVWTGQLLETTPTGQMKPGLHMVTAAFVNPNFSITAPVAKSLSIAREDARLAGLDRTSYSLGGSAIGTVPLTVTVKDISAMVGDAAFDAFAGDIRNAQVQFIDRATSAVLGTATVNALIGPGTTTGTATLNWSVNLGTAASKTYTIGFTVLNYYTRSNFASDNVVVTVSK